MSTVGGSAGTDANISGTKVPPLDSTTKEGVPHDAPPGGTSGTAAAIDHSRIEPLGGHGQYQHPEPHADSQGSVGKDDVISGAKIEPLKGETGQSKEGGTGLDDEVVDASRVPPMGEVREEML